MDQNRKDALLKEYGEVSNNFRLLTDIRFKLLAFLPIATAAAAVLKEVGMRSLVLSLFGFVVTIGLTIYNTRNDQLYDQLVARAAHIERSLGLPGGMFANRPTSWLSVRAMCFGIKIDHRNGVGMIYAASIALWLFGIYLTTIELGRRIYLSNTDGSAITVSETGSWTHLVAFVLVLLSMYFALHSVQQQRETRQRRMRELAVSAVSQLPLELGKAEENSDFVGTCAELAAIDPETVRARAKFYGNLDATSLKFYMPVEPKEIAMSHFVALMTDLPPQWIHDCITNRRGTMKPARHANCWLR